MCVCVFFVRSSTRRHPAHPVSVLILHPRKISSVVTSHDTEIMHRNANTIRVRGVCELRMVRAICMVEQRFMLCAEGVLQ